MAQVRHQIHNKRRISFSLKREPSPSTVRLTAGSTSHHYCGVHLENNISRFPSEVLFTVKIQMGCPENGVNSFAVELRGFEPLTFSLRTRRATNCAIAPGCSG
jgi:hypothetical protein